MASESGKGEVPFSRSDICLDWTPEEDLILQNGLRKYVEEPYWTCYLNTSHDLPKKTTRDVAYRTKWIFENLNEKRRTPKHNLTSQGKNEEEKLNKKRKAQEHNLKSQGKNEEGIKNSVQHQSAGHDTILRRALATPYGELFQQNIHHLNLIRTNLAQSKIQESLELLRQVEANIVKIMNEVGIETFSAPKKKEEYRI